MKANIYVQIEESPSSGYISIKDAVIENKIKNAYKDDIESAKEYGFRNKVEIFEGFKLKYILIEVKYDGRKGIQKEDIKQSLINQELAIYAGNSIFGSHCLATDKLKTILDLQLIQRKELIDQGHYKVIA